MFVSRLDKPWIKTPFLLEGVKISEKEDIARISKFSDYVYVDVDKGILPDPKYIEASLSLVEQSSGKSVSKTQILNAEEIRKLRTRTYEHTETFSAEHQNAIEISERLFKDHNKLLNDLGKGRKIDLSVVRKGVSDMVDSIIRNPSAMMWIAQLKGLDEYTYSRALGTSVWCATFGRHLGLEKASINRLALGGLLLDIGKIRLPLELLKKKGTLTSDEVKQVQGHVDKSVKILVGMLPSESLSRTDIDILQMVATHHERADGSGYPQGLKNHDIPMFGRIAGIIDSYDAMTSERPYMDLEPLAPHAAIAELYDLRGSKHQAELVEQFIQAVGLYPTGSLVELNTGQVAVVVEINGLRRLQPTVMLLLDENKELYDEFSSVDLSSVEGTIKVEKGLPPGAYGINMHDLFL